MGALSLDSADLSRFLRHSANGVTQFDAMVKGAHCAGCLAKIEKGVGGVPDVASARLNLSTGKLAVTGSATLRPELVLRRVADLGYEAAPFEASASLDVEAREGRF